MYKTSLFILIILSVFLNNSCYTPKAAKTVGIAGVNNNVCKKLNGDVVIYAIFVDSKYTNPWTKYDIETTLDSIQTAINWITEKSTENSVSLNIRLEYHSTPQGTIPIKNDFSKKTLSNTLYKKPLWSGIKEVYKWADKIAMEAGKSLPKDTSRVTNIKNDLKTRERLIARLRDMYQTDKVALMYFINNYYTDEISVAFDKSSDTNIEFAIVSFKYPSAIAHEFLHLFGAADLYLTPFDVKKKEQKKKEKLIKMFPDEIMTMAAAYKDINKLNIGGLTKYLIGWDTKLSEEYQKLLLKKGYFAVKY